MRRVLPVRFENPDLCRACRFHESALTPTPADPLAAHWHCRRGDCDNLIYGSAREGPEPPDPSQGAPA